MTLARTWSRANYQEFESRNSSRTSSCLSITQKFAMRATSDWFRANEPGGRAGSKIAGSLTTGYGCFQQRASKSVG